MSIRAIAGWMRVGAWIVAGMLLFGCGSGGARNETDVNALLAEIEAQRQRGSRADTELLKELSQHQEGRVSHAAMSALGHSGTTAGDEHLRGVLRSDANAETRAQAAVALGGSAMADPQEIAVYLTAAQDPVVRAGAAKGLAKWSSPQKREALPKLVQALSDPDPQVRRWAIRGIHRVSVKRFVFDPDAAPETQRERVRYIETRLRQLDLM